MNTAWQRELDLARAAAREAGRAIMRDFRTQQTVIYKSPTQPQTPADLEADRILRERLLAGFPEYGWLSEETLDEPSRLQRERVWIVDPIDGTRSFISGRAEFAISIALAQHGHVVVGIVANPATDELFYATVDGGAFDGTGNALRVSPRANPQGALLVASRSELRAGDFGQIGGEWSIDPLGSTAYKLARIAAGRADIFLSRGPKSEWDVAAGDLLVRTAGGIVTDLHGHTLHYNQPDVNVQGTLATNGRLHDTVLARIADRSDIGTR